MSNLKINWIDRGRDPQCPSNPDYPDGIDIDCSNGAFLTCKTPLPHPTPRCGLWIVYCERCKQRILLTTAGRPDDPRSIKMACLGLVP